MRPPAHIIDFAVEASLNSPCRSKRGVAVFDGENLITLGWNHKPDGFKCDGSEDCKRNCSKDAVHAEQSAIIRAARVAGCEMLHVKTVGGVLVPSGEPSCLQCSKLIIEARLSAMWLFHESGWKRYDPKEFHRLSGAYVPADSTDSTRGERL